MPIDFFEQTKKTDYRKIKLSDMPDCCLICGLGDWDGESCEVLSEQGYGLREKHIDDDFIEGFFHVCDNFERRFQFEKKLDQVVDRIAEQAEMDKLFITEILNDLHKCGFVKQGKGEQMLRDWAAELREKSRTKFPASRLRKHHAEIVGAQNW